MPAAARRLALTVGAILVALPILAACGRSDQPPATATVAATVAGDGTVVDDAGTSGAPDIGGTTGGGAASPAAAGTAGAELTLGALADRVDAAWAGVRTYREVFAADVATPSAIAAPVSSPVASTVASPMAATGPIAVIREVIVPDRIRLVIRTADGVETEAIAIAGRIYVRGGLARLVRPDAAANDWLEVDSAALALQTPLSDALAGLSRPVTSPTAAIPANLRPQEVRPLGTVEVGGRACEAYGAAATTEIGGRLDITLAVGPDDLPCFIETRSPDAGGRFTYEAFNQPLTIEAPDGALPAASPVAPATPLGRD